MLSITQLERELGIGPKGTDSLINYIEKELANEGVPEAVIARLQKSILNLYAVPQNQFP